MARALSGLGKKTVYKLGAGGVDPTVPITPSCDCSGFVAWSIGVPRELPPGSNRWLNTDAMWGGGDPVKAGAFTTITLGESAPGDLLVYPHSGGESGHVGLIVQVDNGMPSKVIHCSHGNFAHFGDAIRLTDPSVFLSTNHPTRCVRIVYEVLQTVG